MALFRTRGLTKHYGQVHALEQLDLEVDPGIIGLVGANGAGKSTLIKILLGLLQATSGSAEVFGLDVAKDGFEIRRRLGYMPEHESLPPDVSATEFVVHMARMSGLPPSAARERTADVLRHVGLYEERYRLIGTYSTGMRQRVKLAQALAHDPDLLLLDEPTNGLDPAGRDEMLDIIRRIGTEFDISVLVASHLLGELERVCDHVVIVDSGRLMRSTSTSEMTKRSQVLTVEVDERIDELASALLGAGMPVETSGRFLQIDSPTDETYDAIRDGAARLGIGLVRMEHRRHHIAELFEREDVSSNASS